MCSWNSHQEEAAGVLDWTKEATVPLALVLRAAQQRLARLVKLNWIHMYLANPEKPSPTEPASSAIVGCPAEAGRQTAEEMLGD